jgi:5-methylcytosine-specific restriction endonuclease McrA
MNDNEMQIKAKRVISPEEKARDAIRKKEWSAKNAGHVKAQRKAKYERTRAESIQKAAEWNRLNKEKRKAIVARYDALNPDQKRATKAVRRARERSAPGRYVKKDVGELLSKQKNLCAACRAKLGDAYEVDHIIPLAGGGSNDRLNLQILCGPCNRSKGARHPIDFMQERGFLL